MRWIWVVVVLAVVAACGSDVSGGDRPSVNGTEYVTLATVLESPEHGPQLCHGVAESMPPQCGGPDIAGWSWDAVDDEASARGTTWGYYAVFGTYTDGVLTLTRPPADPESLELDSDDEDAPDFTSPCPEPAGGWFPAGRTMIGVEDQDRAIRRAEQSPDFGELWVDQRPLGEPSEETMNDPARLILNVRVTGDVDAMESRLREVWGGALCVSTARRTDAELGRIAEEVDDRAGDQLLTSSWGDDRVDVEVVLDEGNVLQDEFDSTYGDGVVRVTSALRAVPDEL